LSEINPQQWQLWRDVGNLILGLVKAKIKSDSRAFR